MIALLRRLRRSAGEITSAEWILLGIEMIAVVGGILIALALENWVQSRNDDMDVARMIDRLVDEAQLNIIELTEHVDAFQPVVEEGEQRAKMLSAGQCPNRSMMQGTWKIDLFPAVTPARAVYDEMIGSTGLSAIEDYDVRLAVTRFRNSLDFLQAQNDHFRGAVDVLADDDPRLSLQYVGGAAATTSIGDTTDVITVDYDRDALCSDGAFMRRLIHATRNQVRVQQYRTKALNDAAYMCKRLAETAGRDCFDKVLRSIIGDMKADNLKQTAGIIEEEVDNF